MTDIGATLREARMRARIDITEVESATKIRTKYLRAMEDEEWGLLPGPTFVKSFLRTYADYLGLDSRLLVEEWKRRHEGPVDAEALKGPSRGSRATRAGRSPGRSGARAAPRTAPPRLPDPPGRWRPFAVVGVAILALLAGLYALGRGFGDNPSPATSPAGPRTHTATHKRPAARPHRKAAPPTRVKLSVAATGTVYVCLEDGHGKALIPGRTLQAGGAPQTFTASRFRLNLGNAAVKLRANGKPIPIAASSSAIGLLITPRGNKPLPAGRRPTCT
jgi:helix-turn-helix protein